MAGVGAWQGVHAWRGEGAVRQERRSLQRLYASTGMHSCVHTNVLIWHILPEKSKLDKVDGFTQLRLLM